MGRPAREPRRTCLGCRTAAPQRELIRLVGRGDGGVVVDRRGTAGGRGAYVHRDPACVDRALSRDGAGVFRALRTRAVRGAAARLRQDIEGELQA